MRMFAQDRVFHRGVRVDLTGDPEALRRFGLLRQVDRARREHGLTLAASLDVSGVARSTYYDWLGRFKAGGVKALTPGSSRPLSHPGRRWTHADAVRVFAVRGEMRWCGKARLHLEHNRWHPDKPLSLAAVGRIAQWGLKAGRIKPCAFWCGGRARAKGRRDFSGGHAQRWRRDDKRQGLQLDHMTLSIDGKVFKEFGFAEPFGVRAVRPKTRRQHAQVFSRATSGVAKAFLAEALQRLGDQPLQVDGGSEFMGDFEDECAERKPPLKVLPPRCLELNGVVERANRTARIECWSLHDGELNRQAMNAALERHLDYYNGPPPPLTRHAHPRPTGYDAGHGRLTENVRKVSDPAHTVYEIVSPKL